MSTEAQKALVRRFVATTPPPLIAALIALCDAYTALMRTALALCAGHTTAESLDPVAPQLAEVAARARALDRELDALVRQLAQAGYTAATARQAVIAAGRADVLDDLEDTLDALADDSQQEAHA